MHQWEDGLLRSRYQLSSGLRTSSSSLGRVKYECSTSVISQRGKAASIALRSTPRITGESAWPHEQQHGRIRCGDGRDFPAHRHSILALQAMESAGIEDETETRPDACAPQRRHVAVSSRAAKTLAAAPKADRSTIRTTPLIWTSLGALPGRQRLFELSELVGSSFSFRPGVELGVAYVLSRCDHDRLVERLQVVPVEKSR